MKIKFYIGSISSHVLDLGFGEQEVHFLDRLDFTLTAANPREATIIENLLRDADSANLDKWDYIRSDNDHITFVSLAVLNGATDEQ
jgi:hypothetical protein